MKGDSWEIASDLLYVDILDSHACMFCSESKCFQEVYLTNILVSLCNANASINTTALLLSGNKHLYGFEWSKYRCLVINIVSVIIMKIMIIPQS